MDTYGELFYDDNGRIRFITGTTGYAQDDHFALHIKDHAAGTYYLGAAATIKEKARMR